MRQEEFLALHDVSSNPFVSAEEAQGDEVLLKILKQKGHDFGHPAWGKFCGVPPGNQTSLIFGPKGSGKTAMRLSLETRIQLHNKRETDNRTLIIRYADFNQYLDCWDKKVRQKKSRLRSFWARLRRVPSPPSSLGEDWMLPDHVDAILAEYSQQMLQLLGDSSTKPTKWPDLVKKDALFITAVYLPQDALCYRNSIKKLYRSLYSGNYRIFKTLKQWVVGICTIGIGPLFVMLQKRFYAKRVDKRIDVLDRNTSDTAWALSLIPGDHLRSVPLMSTNEDFSSQDARYDLLRRISSVVGYAGYRRTVVVVDKVDEPVMIHGDEKKMAQFIKPLLNNKLIQHEGLHFKMLLPYQLNILRRRATPEEANTMRLDKANVTDPFLWTGCDLYNMLTERISACRNGMDHYDIQSLFDQSISRAEVEYQLDKLKTPRYANKFMDRLIRGACSAVIANGNGSLPKISSKTFFGVSAEMDIEMRQTAQDLGEVF